MSEWIARFTELPDLHPALVHFPIALLPAALLFDLLCLGRRSAISWPRRGAALLYAAAALGAGLSYWAGRVAADGLPLLPAAAQAQLNAHADSAWLTLWLIGATAVSRVAVELWDSDGRRLAVRLGLLAGVVVSLALLVRTADLGGGLVYRHGVAVAPMGELRARLAVAEAGGGPRSEVSSRLATALDGTIEWRPMPGDGEALGSVLRPADGSEPGAVSWIEPDESPAAGLGLRVDGVALLLLPGIYGDVQVEAELEVAGYEGTVGLAHHARAADRTGFFSVEVPAAAFVLGSVEAGEVSELDRERGDLPAGRLRLAVSAIGRHQKGLLDGKTVVHGHEAPRPEGGCGILLEGRGVVRVVEMRVAPATG